MRTRFAFGRPALLERPLRLLRHRRAPLVLLVAVCVLGTGARAFRLGTPAATAFGGGYVFDERYYVSAARVIAGTPSTLGDVYAGTSPAGTDPNAEHPQLGKMFIAAGIALLGDNAIGWRSSAVVFGCLAMLLLFWLVRCTGGGQWLALGTVALASVENLWLVHSRIAVLDIYVLPFMLAGAAFYLRRQPVIAGALVGIGCCVKEFALYTLLVILIFELGRVLTRGQPPRALLRPLSTSIVAGLMFITLLAALDKLIQPYSGGRPVDHESHAVCQDLLIWSDACNHLVFMADYATELRDRGHPVGIATAPTEFWLDRIPITYFKSGRTVGTHGVVHTTTLVWYRGELNRVLLFTAWLALLINLWWAVRRRDNLSLLVVAWTLGTWLPAELSHVIDSRTTYLYYMVVTMPALYVSVARLLSLRRIPRIVVVLWTVALLWDFVTLYPLRTLSG